MELLLCPILLSNPPQKSKPEMYFLSCLVLHLRCCFPLEALCVVGRQAFPPLSYILYPRFLAALADQSPKSSSSIWDAQFQRTQSGLPNQGTQKKALWVCFSSCFIFHYGMFLTSSNYLLLKYICKHIQRNHYADIVCPYGSSVPATLQTPGGFVRKLKAHGRSSTEKN